MSQDVKEAVLEEIKKDEGYIKIAKAIFYCIKNNIDHNPFKPNFSEGIKAQFTIYILSRLVYA